MRVMKRHSEMRKIVRERAYIYIYVYIYIYIYIYIFCLLTINTFKVLACQKIYVIHHTISIFFLLTTIKPYTLNYTMYLFTLVDTFKFNYDTYSRSRVLFVRFFLTQHKEIHYFR